MTNQIQPSTKPRVPNDDQKKVIAELDRNIILFASAGTGKTYTVAKRVSHILSSGRATPEEILCLTFTIKAANEMKEDVLTYTGEDGSQVTVKTIHSFCYQVTKEESKRNNDLYSEPMVCDDSDEAEELRNVLKSMGLNEGAPILRASAALNNFMSELKHKRELLNLYTDQEENDYQQVYEYIKNRDAQQYSKVMTFYDPAAKREGIDGSFASLMNRSAGKFAHLYNEKLRQSNLVDFDDLICHVHRLMRDDECRKRWQQRYKYIIIDEMQDTSELEYDTIRQMVGSGNIMMCGDFFQTIYEWRGSRPEKVLNAYIQEFQAKKVMFAENYRSTRTLTMATFGYLQNTYRDLVGKFCPKDIVTKADEKGEKILNIRLRDREAEARWVYDYLRRNCPDDPARVCIMTRSNGYISDMYRELTTIASCQNKNDRLHFFTVDTDAKFFRKAIIKDVMAFINVTLNKTDLVSMARIVQKYAEGIGIRTIEAINSSGEIGVSLCSFLDPALYEHGDPYQPLMQAYQNSNVVVFDTETTGLDLSKDQIIQLSAIKLNSKGEIIGTLDRLVIPTIPISKGAQATHHQTYESIVENGGIAIETALREFSDFVKGSVLVGHNSIRFDMPLIRRQLRECKLPELKITASYDTMIIAKQFLPKLKNYKLDTLCGHYRFVNENAHNALGDITATGKVLTALVTGQMIPSTGQRKAFLAKYKDKFRPISRFIAELDSLLRGNQVCPMFERIVSEYSIRDRYDGANDGIVLDDLLYAIKRTPIKNGEAFLREFVADAALSGSQMDLLIQKLHKIPIITVHQSKGCEFDTVLIVGADDDNFPTYIAKKNNMTEEEKRVFYVAITRAKKKLILTSITSKTNRGGTWSVQQSRYIANIPAEYIETRNG